PPPPTRHATGARRGEQWGVPYLLSDFKKKNGYKRSVQLSAEYGLYRQDYCGCVFSQAEARARKSAGNGR
ncbi:MAG: epoxyqueuosine reductase QueH, partial [Clostridium sp.]|nr:epoxyqueuosine reductase QueH [Clostridium sp.]